MNTDAAKFNSHNMLEDIKNQFKENKTTLSFTQYLNLVEEQPQYHIRSSAKYFADVIKHFGQYSVELPYGSQTRYKVFDCLFDESEGKVFGQEKAQSEIVKKIDNFVRCGRIDRLILLHGPNGSAKTSIIHALSKAAEFYSKISKGALYKFNWVFPNDKVNKGSMGFNEEKYNDLKSFAHLAAEDIDAIIPCEYKDHPLLLLPVEHRQKFILSLIKEGKIAKNYTLPDILLKGDLSTKNHKIFNTLMNSYQGQINKVFRHIQVERFYLSRRYRTGVASVEPQMGVDAHVRQISADQSMASLPSTVNHLSLFEVGGSLCEGNRGLIEYNDLLKRPVDAWKYLLAATEQASVTMDLVTLFLDAVMIGSSNELHLSSFKEYPDWPSFKGRIELVKAPYLLRLCDEVEIYQHQIPKALNGLHIAPHAIELAAMFAVLTRLEPPQIDKYKGSVKDVLFSLTPMEKLHLYNKGNAPHRLSQSDASNLKKLLPSIVKEYQNEVNYEGRFGASVREMRSLLLSASQNKNFNHLSPIAVLEELRLFTKETSSYDFLRRESMRGYRDAKNFVDGIEKYFIQQTEENIANATGLIVSNSDTDLLTKYILNISAWTKGEKLYDDLSGKMIAPNYDLMNHIEKLLVFPTESIQDFRHSIISKIGAYKLENPTKEVDYGKIFSSYLQKIKDDYYTKQKTKVDKIKENFLIFHQKENNSLSKKEISEVKELKQNLKKLGYNDSSSMQAIVFLLTKNK